MTSVIGVLEAQLEKANIPGTYYCDIKSVSPSPEKNDVFVFIGQVPDGFINPRHAEFFRDIFQGKINNIFLSHNTNNKFGCFHAAASLENFTELQDLFHKKAYFGRRKFWHAQTPEQQKELSRIIDDFRIRNSTASWFPRNRVVIELSNFPFFKEIKPNFLEPQNIAFQYPRNYSAADSDRGRSSSFDFRTRKSAAFSFAPSVRVGISVHDPAEQSFASETQYPMNSDVFSAGYPQRNLEAVSAPTAADVSPDDGYSPQSSYNGEAWRMSRWTHNPYSVECPYIIFKV